MDFGARTFELPECHSVPRTKFDVDRKTKRGNPVYANVHGFDHAGALRELQRHVFGPEVQHDHRLLSRIVYRNRNQHRGSVHFRRFEELRRGLKILQGLQIPVLVDRIQAAFYPVGVSRKRRAEWQMLPCRYYMTAVVGRLVWVGRFLEKLQMVCHRCFVQCTGQVAVTLFMPLMIVVQGIAARLQVCCGYRWRAGKMAVASPGLPRQSERATAQPT
ncbi:hypothetical protein GGI26_003103 [Coemansia sp. RSA 1358]|nr:hypothetical protein GGI26_003103 [Coemansia sp. RSA 1358]